MAAMRRAFPLSPNRDAWAVFRGFLYQVRHTVLRWLSLDADTVLLCEWGEDLALVRSIDTDAAGDVEYYLEQIKYRARHVTLRTPQVYDALSHFFETWAGLRGTRLVLRFTTNAAAGQERDTAFPGDRPGISAWNHVRKHEINDPEVGAILALIRRVLASGPTLDDEPRYERLRQFANHASDDDLFEFVRAVEWAVGQPEHHVLSVDIQTRLVERGLATVNNAGAAADRLTVVVLDTLTAYGEKRLDVAALGRALGDLTLSDRDRGVIERLSRLEASIEGLISAVPAIEARVEHLEESEERLTAELQTLQAAIVRKAGQLPETEGAVTFGVAIPLLDAPPNPLRYATSRTRAVAELVQEGQAARWLHLIASTGMGKTYLARTMMNRLPASHHAWISLTGYRERPDGSEVVTRHLSDQVVAWAIRLDNDPVWWELYRRGEIAPASLLSAVLQRSGGAALIVVDDLPDLATMPQVTQSIVAIARALHARGDMLITTGQWRLVGLTGQLEGVEPPHEVEIGPIDAADFLDLLTAAGAPDRLRTPEVITLLQAATGGHPALALGVVRWLEERAWVLDGDRLLGILTGAATADEREAARRRMLALVANQDQRELLSRLSLVGRQFDRSVAEALAEVPQQLDRPGEVLEQLAGVWLNRLENDRYEVSPLLSDVGKHHLPEERQRAVHTVIASRLLRPRPVMMDDAFYALVHLGAAKAWATFAIVHTQMMLAVTTQDQAKWLSPVASIFVGTPWPDGIPLFHRIMIRALQVKIAVLAGLDTQALVQSADELIGQAGAHELDQAAVSFARMILGFYAAGSRGDAMHRALQAIETIRGQQDFVRDQPDAATNARELVWLQAVKAETFPDLVDVIHTLGTMGPEDTREIWNAELAIEASRLIVDRTWEIMAKRSEADRNWDAVLQAFRELEALAESRGLSGLRTLVRRGQAIVLADYLGRSDDALALLEEAQATDDRDCVFMARFTRASILMDEERWQESIDEYARAIATPGERFGFERYLAHAWAAVTFGRLQRWDDTIRYAQAGIQLARQAEHQPTSRIPFWNVLELHGELTMALWHTDRHRAAVGVLEVAVNRLIPQWDPDNGRAREVLRKLRHVLNWVAFWATTIGRPAGEPPQAGFCVWSNESLRTTETPLLIPTLPFVLGQTSAGLELRRRALREISRAATMAQEQNLPWLYGFVQFDLAVLASALGRFDSAVASLIDGVKSTVASGIVAGRGEDLMNSSVSPDDIWQEISPERRTSALTDMLWLALIPGIARALRTADDGRNIVIDRDRFVSQIAIVTDNVYGERLLDAIRSSLTRSRRDDVVAALHALPADDTTLRLLLYLALAEATGARLEDAARAHAIVLAQLIRMPGRAVSPARRDFSAYLATFWRAAAIERGFLLRSPGPFRERVEMLPDQPTIADICRLLLWAEEATEVSFPHDARELLVATAAS